MDRCLQQEEEQVRISSASDSAGAGGRVLPRGRETMEGVPLSTGKLQLGITGEFLQRRDGRETSTSIRESDRTTHTATVWEAAKARAGT